MLKKLSLLTLVGIFLITATACDSKKEYGEIKEVNDEIAEIEDDYSIQTDMDKTILFQTKNESTESKFFIQNLNSFLGKEYSIDYTVLPSEEKNNRKIYILAGDNPFYFGIDEESTKVNYVYLSYMIYDMNADFDKEKVGTKLADHVSVLCYSAIENITKTELNDIHQQVKQFILEKKDKDTLSITRKRWKIELKRDLNKVYITMEKQ